MTPFNSAACERRPQKRAVRVRWKRGAVILLVAWLIAGAFLFWIFYRRPLWVMDEAMHARLHYAGMHSRFVRVGPYRVHYFVGGHGQPLLLIHGLGSRSEDWTPEIPAYVKSGFRVYAIDLLGCGRTDHPDIAYTIQQQADLAHGFLDAVHVPQADVIGWSMGGWVALRFAVDHPESVRRLVAMDSAGLSFSTTLTSEVFEPQTISQLIRLEVLLDPHPPWLPGFFNRALLRAMRSNFTVVHRTVQSMVGGRDLLDGQLNELTMPVLLVWGAQDALIPPSVGLRMHEAIPQSVLEIYSRCGHAGPATCRNRIVPRVIDFLQKDPPPTAGVRHY
jgi:pimeloyl-ACP methyl ester carboxylesterase